MDVLADSAFGNLDALDYLLIALTAAGSAMISALSGMGGGLLMAVVLAPIVGVKALVPLIAIASIFTNFGRLVFYFRELDPRIAAIVLFSSTLGSWLGTDIYAGLDPAAIAFLLGAMLIVAVPLRRGLAGRRWAAGPGTLLAMGFVFGVISGTSVGAGILLVPVLLGAGLAGPALLGTDALVGIVNTVFRAGMFAWHGLLTIDLLIAGVLIGLCTLPGSWVAAQIVRRTDIRLHTLILEVLIVLGGAAFLWRAFALSGWLPG